MPTRAAVSLPRSETEEPLNFSVSSFRVIITAAAVDGMRGKNIVRWEVDSGDWDFWE